MEDDVVCRTCLQPNETLIDEGGVLFCLRCLANYKFLMAWMKGENPPPLESLRRELAAKLKPE